MLASAPHDRDAILFADVDSVIARDKLIVNIPDDYEIDRLHWRRPDMYGTLVEGKAFAGHGNPRLGEPAR